ncbi:MAG: hypothetical protein RDU83_10355 [bacterium]|nr:hypothetical protein [bacterium]
MKHYPILYAFRDKVSGNGFLADVSVHGRALASEEEDGWWLFGVEPGDVVAEGRTFAEAGAEFPLALKAVLFDIADEAKDYADFEAEVRRFFDGVNRVTEQGWEAAVTRIRAGEAIADAISSLPVWPAESPRVIEVKLLDQPMAKDNVLDPQPLALAA